MDNDIICLCNNVTVGDIRKAIDNGAKSFEEVREKARFGNGCSLCVETIRKYVKCLQSQT